MRPARAWKKELRKTDRARKPKRGGGRRRLLLFLTLLLIGGLIGGFFVFAHHVDSLQEPTDLPRADGIVVWTGKGGGRLEMAGRMLRDGRGERLLVSGVNRSLDAEQVADLSDLSEGFSSCCLDIDYAAEDTRGNARETAAWARALGYDHIILVTSAYHMPRARVEIGHAGPSLRITPVAVMAAEPTQWWQDFARFRRLLGEYGKYLLALARGRSGTRGPLPDSHDTVPNLDATPE